MANKNTLKGYFQTGLRPTQANFEELIESTLNLIDDKASTSDAEDQSIDNKFITPKTAKVAVEKFAPVKKVNGVSPDANGAINFSDITGTASTITGSISKSQVTGLQSDLDAKQATLQSSVNIKTINGQSIVGPGDLTVPFPSIVSAVLSSPQTSNTTSAVVLTGHTFTIPAGKTALIKGNLIFSTGASAVGCGYGVKVAQASGANAAATGSWSIEVAVSGTASNSSLRDGDVLNVVANSSATGEVVSSSSDSTNNNSAILNAIIKNNASNAATTVTLVFHSSSTGTVTALVGSGAVVIIS